MSASAAIAAARIQKQRMAEEESMTTYSPEELEQDWEFKILRSNTEAFGNPATLQKACAEEAAAGWVLVEKFDNARLRFKRRRSARAGDAALPPGTDPYRTYFGISTGPYVLIAIGVTLLIIFGTVMLVMLASGAG